jgi:septum formation topological specificity factor MinE
MKLPFISRKKHEKKINNLKNEKITLQETHEKELNALQREIEEVLPKFLKIDAEKVQGDRDFRIMITLGERQIQAGLLWGNSNEFIKAIAYNIGQRAIYEIRKINSFR